MEAGNRSGGQTRMPSMNGRSRSNGQVPQLFNSVPSLDEAVSYLAETTSYITQCFSDSPGIAFGSARATPDEQEMVTFASEQTEANDRVSSNGNYSAFSRLLSTVTAAPPIHEGIFRSSSGESSQNAGASAEPQSAGASAEPQSAGASAEPSPTVQNGVSLFQGIIERARKTVRGSADDIGWLKRASEMPPVEDGTERFMEILDHIRHGVHKLPDSVVYLLVPGLFSNHGSQYFVSTKTSFSKMGLACHIAKIHSEASVEKNANVIKDYIEEIYWGSNKRVLLLGHSKGGVDSAAALSMYWPELNDKVAGLALAQSPYGGSPIASDILREGQLGDYVNVRKMMEYLFCKVVKGDLQALEDLTYERRKEFLRKYPLPKELPVVSFHTEASISPAVLSTLSHVAHAELPTPLLTGELTKVPVVVPLGAAMAACAQLLQIRYGEKSDGLVTCRDAEVPGSVVVRPKQKLDHAWMVYSLLKDDPSAASPSQVCEALLTLLMEVGQKKRHELTKKDE